MLDPVPPEFTGSACGRILKRRTTYVQVEMGVPQANLPPRRYRIDYIRKRDLYLEDAAFQAAAVEGNHPLLLDYVEPSLAIYINSVHAMPHRLLEELTDLTDKHFNGFRSFWKYANTLGPEAMLRCGHGLLLEGPASLVWKASDILRTHAVRHGVWDQRQPLSDERRAAHEAAHAAFLREGAVDPKLFALLLGRYYVIGDGFRFREADA